MHLQSGEVGQIKVKYNKPGGQGRKQVVGTIQFLFFC